jgi:hypothetical protein
VKGAVLALLLAAAPLAAQGPQAFKLPTGLDCVLVENHERPLIRMELVCRWDRSELPAGKEGIGGFLAQVMAAGGAGPNTRPTFLHALDGLGMRFSFRPQLGCYRWTLAADSRSQEAAMELLADAVVRPVFDGPLVEAERQAALKRTQARSQRDRAQARFLWHLGDPDSFVPPGPTPLERIEYQDLLDFRRRVIRPEGSTLVMYGDLNLTQAKQLVFMHLGIWGPGGQAPVKGAPPKANVKAVPEPRLLAVLEPSPGAEIWAGAPCPADPGGPAVRALLPTLLVRAARSFFGSFAMTFQLSADPQAPLLIKGRVPQADRDNLVSGFKAGLDGLRTSGFSADDLASALVKWKAENNALALHPEAMVRALIDGRLDPDLDQAVERVTLKEVDQALREWLDPERVRFLLLGADAPMIQAAEKAGLGPSALMGNE